MKESDISIPLPKPVPYRKVVALRFYKPKNCGGPNRGSYMVTLECGHQLGRKYSEINRPSGTPKRMRCIHCA
jgi:hypothetical protein